MTLDQPTSAPIVRADSVDLATVLAAWQSATDRLQRTHLTLQAEVRRLSDELEAKNRLLARENRLADLGRIASHVAHEVRNGLMPLTLYVSVVRRKLVDDETGGRAVEKIETALTALEATVNDLLHFSSDRQPQWQIVPLRRVVEKTCEGLSLQLEAQSITLQLDVPAGLCVWADPSMVHRALLNLLLNAIDVMPEGGELCITGWEGPGVVELEIADSGPGLSEPMVERIFEPFFTTKSGGTGLGLAIVRRIMEAHNGDATAKNCPQGGTAFTLRFPRPAQEAAA